MKRINYYGQLRLFLLGIVFFFACVFSSCSDYSKKLGNGYTYMHEGGNNNFIFHEYPQQGGEIPPNVISYNYDKHFIVVKQKPMPFQYGYETAEEYANRTDTIPFCYWLILKKEQKVFGPFDYNNFQKHKKSIKFLINWC